MSKYTTEVRFICESVAGNSESVGGNGIDSVIQRAIPHIFDFDFPIFRAEYRNVLATKILKHYYTREIGYETYGLWKFKLGVRLNEIMPYFNQLYESTLLEFNPLLDVDYTRKHEGERNKEEQGKNERVVNTTNQGNTESTGWNLYSDTPQGTIGNIENGSYMTNATKVTDSNSGSSTTNQEGKDNISSTVKDVDSFLETVKGKIGGSDYSEKLMKYRQTFLNIDMMVIEALSDLFMNLW